MSRLATPLVPLNAFRGVPEYSMNASASSSGKFRHCYEEWKVQMGLAKSVRFADGASSRWVASLSSNVV